MHLPSGGKPPATDEEECLREFRDSEFGKDSVSEAVYLLPLALAWDKFYRSIFTTPLIKNQYTFAAFYDVLTVLCTKNGLSCQGFRIINFKHCT